VEDNSPYARLKRVIYDEKVRARSKDNPLICDEGHAMAQRSCSDGPYASGWFCDRCRRSGKKPSEPRHFCQQCCADVCYTCEPVVGPDGSGAVGFEEHLRSLMPQLQALTLVQCAGLVSVACTYGKLRVVQILLEMIAQFEDPAAVRAMLDKFGAGYVC
jgi:hypothetical protein